MEKIVADCDHPEPDLCAALGRHITGRLWEHWHQREDYRQAWCKRAGVDVLDLEKRFPPGSEKVTKPKPQPSRAKVLSLLCMNRGSALRKVRCKPCQGQTEAEILECSVHGECSYKTGIRTNGMTGTVVKSCVHCEDRKPPMVPGKWAVGVTTAPRENPTLQACLDSMHANGWQPVVYAEPGSTFAGTTEETLIIERPQKLGCWHNWLQALVDLLDRFPEAEWVMTVQDDCVFAPDVKRFLESQWLDNPPGKLGMFSLYTSSKYLEGKQRKPGLFQMPLRSWWGALAMCFPRKVAEEILTLNLTRDWTGASARMRRLGLKKDIPSDQIKHVDTFMGNAIKQLKKRIYGFHPSLSDHVADHSTVGHGGRGGRRRARKVAQNPFLECKPKGKPFQFVGYAQMTADARRFAQSLRGKIGSVCGIPRSGIPVASVIAQELMVPLVPIEDLQGGYRPEKSRGLVESDLPCLVVDDTTNTGKTLREIQDKVEGDVVFGSLYTSPKSPKIDFSLREIPQPRAFEWTILRDYNSRYCCVDLDGVLCEDWQGNDEAEPERYAGHLENVEPLAVATGEIGWIVTNRLERYRRETQVWLNAHGIRYKYLIMNPAKTSQERRENGFADWKAEVYRGLGTASLFIESDPKQAKRIHQLTGKSVLCYQSMEFLQ